MKSFKIILDENDIDNLTDDYQMVEVTIEEIMSQAKSQGYVLPDKRPDEKSDPDSAIKLISKLKILTNEYITARLTEFQQKFMDYDIGKPIDKTMRNGLNDLFIKTFGKGKVNPNMFDFQNHDCIVNSSHIAKKLYIQCNARRKKIFNPRQKDELYKKYHNDKFKLKDSLNTFELGHSHNIPFTEFCCQHCNPWIMNELEKLIFEFL